MTSTEPLDGLSQADAIRRAIEAVGMKTPDVVAWLAEHGRPGVPTQRVADIARRDGLRPVIRHVAKVPRPGTQRAREHAARVPTATQRAAAATAASEGGRLAALWAAEAPAASWRADLEGDAGRECPECGGPVYWAGAHTVQVCPARHNDGLARKGSSPASDERDQAHADQRAERARRRSLDASSDQADGDQAESDADAIELERRKGALIGQLDGLDGDHLTPDVRRVLAWFRRQIDAASGDARLDALTELFAEAGIQQRGLFRRRLVLDPSEYDDGDQADGDQAGRYQPGQLGELARQAGVMPRDRGESWAERGERQIREARERAAAITIRPARPLADGRTPVAGPWCEFCKHEHRYLGGTYPPAAARAEWSGLIPAPVDLCTDHLIAAMREHGAAVSVSEWFLAAGAPLRIAYENTRRERAGLPPLSQARIMALAGIRFVPPDPSYRAESNGARR